jgi:hypothetical protein
VSEKSGSRSGENGLQDFLMGGSEPMIPIEEKIELPWTQMEVYFPLAGAKKLIPVKDERRGH